MGNLAEQIDGSEQEPLNPKAPAQGSEQIDRARLFATLSGLPQPQFDQLLFILNPPVGIVPGPQAASGNRVSALLEWAKGPTGCGLEKLQQSLNSILPPAPSPHSEPATPVRIDSPYKPIVEAFLDGTVIPFLGSGINLCNRLPILDGALKEHQLSEILKDQSLSEIELAWLLVREIQRTGPSGIMELIGFPCLFCHLDLKDRPDKCPILEKIRTGERDDGFDKILKCPLATEQSLAIAKTNLRFLSQHYKTEKNPKSLYDFVQESFKASKPNRLHRFLAEMPHKMSSLPYPLIVTTNYDTLLEDAFRACGQPFDVVFYVAQDPDYGDAKFKHKRHGESRSRPIRKANQYRDLPLGEYPIILKLYGSLEDRSFVITEDHHIDYLLNSDLENSIPSPILNALRENSILFLGYSLSDYDLRLILHQNWARCLFNSKSSWFIHKSRPGSLEAKVWEKRGVTLIDSRIEDCLTHLETGIGSRLRELGEHG